MKSRLYNREFPMKYSSQKIPKGYAMCRSPLEYEVFCELDSSPEVVNYTPEPFDIPYHFNGKAHKYIPDILINYVNGNKKLVEIKKITDIAEPRNKVKLTAAQQFCKSKNLKFELWTRKVKGSISSRFYPRGKNYDCWEDAYKDLEALEKQREKIRKRKQFFQNCRDIIKLLIFLAIIALILINLIKVILDY